jgi:hypothetical protein
LAVVLELEAPLVLVVQAVVQEAVLSVLQPQVRALLAEILGDLQLTLVVAVEAQVLQQQLE